MNAHAYSLASLFALTVFLPGCNIFETREPEPPLHSSSNYVPPTEPSLVFSNMINSFRDLSSANLSSVNYLRSFADSATAGRSFVFEPTPQAKLKYGGVFLSWSSQSEQQYFENLGSKIPSGSSASLVFDGLTAQSLQSDSAQYEASYSLTVASVSKHAQGLAQFFLVVDNSSKNWVICRWIDVPTGTSDYTWSDLKGEYGQ